MGDTFDIVVNDATYTVLQEQPEIYKVFIDNDICTFFPVWEDDNLVWKCHEDLPDTLVEQIGDAIERHDM